MRTVRCSDRLIGGGICLGGCLPRECLPRGCLPGGFLSGSVHPPPIQRQTTPMNRITDRCKKLHFPPKETCICNRNISMRSCRDRQDCIPVGCIPPACWPYLPACSVPGGLDLIPLNFPLGCGPGSDPPQFPPWVWDWRGGLLLGGSSSWGVGVYSWGVSPPGGYARGVVSQHALRQTPPVDRITDACKNITLPQLRCGW